MPFHPNLQRVNPPHFVVNADGQLQLVNPLMVFQTGDNPHATTSHDYSKGLDLQSALENTITDSITQPINDFFQKNNVNIVVLGIGVVVLILGLVELKAV